MKKPFIIYAYPFSFGIGGVKVLHKLCDALNKRGESAYLYPVPFPGGDPTYYAVNDSYSTPIITKDICNNIEDCIAIYPEVIQGNPLKAKTVVRWILNDASPYMHTYKKDDIVFYFLELFYNNKMGQMENNLQVWEFHKNIFNNFHLNRNGSCYAIRKCPNPKLIHPKESLEIKWNDVGDLEYLSNIFNTKQTFYCYDDVTFLSTQSAMCGCLTIVVPFRYTKTEWYEKYGEAVKYGIAYGNEESEIEHAKSTIHLIDDQIKKIESKSDVQLDNFIKICQK